MTTIVVLVSFLTIIIILYKWLFAVNNNGHPLLPSPPKLPLLGNLHQLGTLPHRSLRSLSKQYGDLMLLHLGSVGTKPALVVSSPNRAEEILRTHDIVFANRSYSKATRILVYDGIGVVFGNYGEYWRKLKSICVLNMLSHKKVQSYREIRKKEVDLMIESIRKSTPHTPVDLSDSFVKLSDNVMFRVVFGRNDGCANIREILNDINEAMGAFSIGNFVPWLSWIDNLRGVLRKATKVAKTVDVSIQKIVDEHVNAQNQNEYKANKEEKTQNLVDVLLEIQKNDPSFQMDTLKALILDVFAAGVETTVVVLEWTMSELLRHPQVMKTLQEEVREFLKDKSTIDEDDLKEMNYLKAVIKEALRLYPPAPFLLFREPSEDTKVENYDIAAGTQIIINAWAIQRNPIYWDEPDEFRPERFLNSMVNTKGSGCEFIPFGAGRRGCPGMSFANVVMELALANLVGKFDWKLPSEVSENSFMAESLVTLLRRRDNLFAIPTPYSNKH